MHFSSLVQVPLHRPAHPAMFIRAEMTIPVTPAGQAVTPATHKA